MMSMLRISYWTRGSSSGRRSSSQRASRRCRSPSMCSASTMTATSLSPRPGLLFVPLFRSTLSSLLCLMISAPSSTIFRLMRGQPDSRYYLKPWSTLQHEHFHPRPQPCTVDVVDRRDARCSDFFPPLKALSPRLFAKASTRSSFDARTPHSIVKQVFD